MVIDIECKSYARKPQVIVLICSTATEVGFGRHLWDIPLVWVLDDKNIRVSCSKLFV